MGNGMAHEETQVVLSIYQHEKAPDFCKSRAFVSEEERFKSYCTTSFMVFCMEPLLTMAKYMPGARGAPTPNSARPSP